MPHALAVQREDDPVVIKNPEDADVEVASLWRELMRRVSLRRD
jgi:hypothetical protein